MFKPMILNYTCPSTCPAIPELATKYSTQNNQKVAIEPAMYNHYRGYTDNTTCCTSQCRKHTNQSQTEKIHSGQNKANNKDTKGNENGQSCKTSACKDMPPATKLYLLSIEIYIQLPKKNSKRNKENTLD
jgi:uncharacterized protein (DUF2225 family)